MQYPDFESYLKSLGWRERWDLSRDAVAGRVGADARAATVLRDYCRFRLNSPPEKPWAMGGAMAAMAVLGFVLLPTVFSLTSTAGVLIAALVVIPLTINRRRKKLTACMEANHRALTERYSHNGPQP